MKRIVVFASGSGTNFQAVIDAVESGNIQAEIAGLIASKQNIKSIERAQKYDIPVRVIPKKQFESEEAFADELLTVLNDWETDLIVLAGYMQKIPQSVIRAYRRRMINIHPSLLPKYGGKGFYGERVHRAVIENEEEQSGCTVHYVTEEYDQGPIIDQRTVEVKEDDTPESLAARILKHEHKLLPSVIADIVNDDAECDS